MKFHKLSASGITYISVSVRFFLVDGSDSEAGSASINPRFFPASSNLKSVSHFGDCSARIVSAKISYYVGNKHHCVFVNVQSKWLKNWEI